MKTYDETIRTVFTRIEAYRKRRKRRNRWIAAAVPLAACLVLWLGLRQTTDSKPLAPAVQDQPASSAAEVSQAEDTITVHAIGDSSTAQEDDKIFVHAVDGIFDSDMNICLLWEDYVPLDRDEMNAYYGTNVFPTVPDDLAEWEDQQYGIFRRNGGTGEVYWDGNVLNYSNEDFSRSVSVEMMKGHFCPTCYVFFDSVEEKSIIRGVEVALGLSSNGYYYAEFMYNDVGFFVITEGFSQQETIDVLSSLLQ